MIRQRNKPSSRRSRGTAAVVVASTASSLATGSYYGGEVSVKPPLPTTMMVIDTPHPSGEQEVLVLFSPEQQQQQANMTKLVSSSGNSSAASTASCSDDSGSVRDDDGLVLPLETSSSASGGGGVDAVWSATRLDRTAQVWELSAAQRADLVQLGHQLRDIDHFKNDPMTVIRFLRARKGNVHAAEVMFRRMISWRNENKVDTILQDYQPDPEDLRLMIPAGLLQGLDADGDPILFSKDGDLDGPALLERLGHDGVLRLMIWLREKLHNAMFAEFEKRHGRPFKQATCVSNVHGLKTRNLTHKATRDVLLASLKADQENYPEMAKRGIIIGVPGSLVFAFNALKFVLGEHSEAASKTILAGNKNWEKAISKYVDPEVLPDLIAPGVGSGEFFDFLEHVKS